MSNFAKCITLFCLIHAIAACTKPPPPPMESKTAPIRFDAKLLQVADRVPQFGGLYFDDAGRLVVYLAAPVDDLGTADLASLERRISAAIIDVYGRPALTSTKEQGAAPSEQAELRMVRGDYTIRQLTRWAVALLGALKVPGVFSTGVDERRNRVSIGIADEGARAAVQRLVAEAGIPAAAVLIEARDPIRFYQSLRDRERPVLGGMQVDGSGNTCTMGFNARLVVRSVNIIVFMKGWFQPSYSASGR